MQEDKDQRMTAWGTRRDSEAVGQPGQPGQPGRGGSGDSPAEDGASPKRRKRWLGVW